MGSIKRSQLCDSNSRLSVPVSVPKRREKCDVAIEEQLGALGIRHSLQLRILCNPQNFTSCPRTASRNPLDVVAVIGKYVLAPIRDVFQRAQHDVTQRVEVDPVVLRQINLTPKSSAVQASPVVSAVTEQQAFSIP